MSTNISKQKREDLLAKIKEIPHLPSLMVASSGGSVRFGILKSPPYIT